MSDKKPPELEELRLQIREWLGQRHPSELVRHMFSQPLTVAERFHLQRRWHRDLAEGGWLGLTWPAEYGGRGLSLAHELVLQEELEGADAPPLGTWVGLDLVGPTLLQWGTEQQRRSLLPPILAGDQVWCQGFSEPAAGSDLAAVTTSARRADAGWVVQGHKRWISFAQFSDWCLLLARTGTPESRHRGLTCFVMPLDHPAVTVEPIRMLYGDAEECEVVIEGLHLPDDAVVGEIGQGWRVVMTSLTLARGTATLSRIAALRSTFARMVGELVAAGAVDAKDRFGGTTTLELATLHAQLRALRHLAYRKVEEIEKEGSPGHVASAEKLLWGRLWSRVALSALNRRGLSGAVVPGPATEVATGWHREFYRALASEIEGGTNEIQRTIIARHVLGLPC